MSDDVIFKQEVRASAFELLCGAVRSLDGTTPQALPVGRASNARDCIVARTFNAALPQPVVVLTDRLLVAAKSDARQIRSAWGSKYRSVSVDQVLPEFRDMFKGLKGVYEVDLPDSVAHFIHFFDHGAYPDLQLPARDEEEELMPSLGGSGDGGTGGIQAEVFDYEASQAVVGGSEAGGGA